MRTHERGFTLIELMIVVAIIGVLAAIAIPNYISLSVRAKEGTTKSNMHSFQLAAEDYCIDHDGMYASDADSVASRMPAGAARFKNPFTGATGSGGAYEYQASWTVPILTSGAKGIVAYGDSATMLYQIAGHGGNSDFNIILTSGR